MQTFLCNAQFIVLLPVYELTIRCGRGTGTSTSAGTGSLGTARRDGQVDKVPLLQNHSSSVAGATATDAPAPVAAGSINSAQPPAPAGAGMGGVMTRWATAKAALRISPFWFMAQWTFNLSLSMTSITSNTIISSTAAVWTLAFAALFAGEQFRWSKLFGTLCCVGGTALVAFGDLEAGGHDGSNATNNTTAPHGQTYGNGLCLLSAVIYAAYTILIRRAATTNGKGKEHEPSMLLLLGFIGLFTFACLGPVVLVLGATGVISTNLSREHVR